MWAEACALLDEAERRHRHFFELLSAPRRACVGAPGQHLCSGYRSARHGGVPGARVEDVVTQITPSGLLIETTVPPPHFEAGVEVVRLEIPYGRMRRRIELPAGRYTLIEHRLDRGYLFLRLTGSNI